MSARRVVGEGLQGLEDVDKGVEFILWQWEASERF